jgi:hypothetical protein
MKDAITLGTLTLIGAEFQFQDLLAEDVPPAVKEGRSWAEDVRGVLESAEADFVRIDKRETLSETGRKTAIKEGAVAALEKVHKSAARVESALEQNRQAVMQSVRTEPSQPDAEGAQIASDIRRHLAGLPPHQRDLFVRTHGGDAQLIAAIERAPAYLSGMNDQERTELIKEARLAAHPEKAIHLRRIDKAVNATRLTRHRAETMLIERAQLRKARDGATWLFFGEPDNTQAPRLGV